MAEGYTKVINGVEIRVNPDAAHRAHDITEEVRTHRLYQKAVEIRGGDPSEVRPDDFTIDSVGRLIIGKSAVSAMTRTSGESKK